MGAHRLTELRWEGAAAVLQTIPDFDLYQLEQVERLRFSKDAETGGFRLELDVSYRGTGGVLLIELTFTGVQMMRLPEFSPTFSFGELEVEDLSGDQLEEVRYRARDHLMSDFELNCWSVQIRVLSGGS